MTITLDPTLDDVEPQPEPEDEARYRITARGAIALGRRIDPTGRGPLVAYSADLNRYVTFR